MDTEEGGRMSKHTPGPWTADGTRVYIGDNPKDVGSVANARLIAAAPDLLEALKGVVATNCAQRALAYPDTFADLSFAIAVDAARAAIAKAEGAA